MLKFHLKVYPIILFSGLITFGCSQLGLQSKNDVPEISSIPDCRANYTKEGNWIAGRVYKTWIKYDNLDFKRGFDAALAAIQTHGDQSSPRINSSDRQSGVICGEMALGVVPQPLLPVEIRLMKEKTSVTVHISSNASKASDPANFCKFFTEFEKQVKRPAVPNPPKQVLVPSQKTPEKEKDAVPPSQPPVFPSPPAPPPSPSPRIVQSQTRVIWAIVNFREGPGTNYKVIGQIKRGAPLEIFEEKGGWLHTRLEDGREGWVSKAATSSGNKTPVSRSSSPRASPAVKLKSPM
jgi:hypothetical protein